jgi:ATP-dependent DNA helicase RecQ
MRHDGLDAARDLLRNTFGHADFRGLQAGVIGEILAGRSALAVLPTGGGKSLCYQYLRWSDLASVWSSRP